MKENGNKKEEFPKTIEHSATGLPAPRPQPTSVGSGEGETKKEKK